jgi:hypothetical protein
VSGVLAILATYDFIAFFVNGTTWRRLGTLLVILGGGLGWLLIVIGQGSWLGSLPLDFYSPESFGFLSIYGIPHLALARAALLWGLLNYLRAVNLPQPPRLRSGLTVGAIWFLAALAQPLEALVFGFAIFLYLVVRLIEYSLAAREERAQAWIRFKGALLLAVSSGIVPVLFLLYTFVAFRSDPFLVAWTTQNLILSPHPLHYLIAYGLLLPFSLIGVLHHAGDRHSYAKFLTAWAVSLPFLAYLPFNLQRRLPEGIWAVLVILALWGLQYLAREQEGKLLRRPFSTKWVTGLCFGTTLLLLTGGLLAALRPALPVFRPADEVQAFDYLSTSVKPGDIVLSAYESGNALPAWAPVRVLIGHGPESIGLAELRPEVKRIFGLQSTDQERLSFFNQYHVRYIFWGPAERGLGGWDPDSAWYLTRVYTKNAYSVFIIDE